VISKWLGRTTRPWSVGRTAYHNQHIPMNWCASGRRPSLWRVLAPMNAEDDCHRETRPEWLAAVRSRLDARFFEGLSEEITSKKKK
jgi:hypothetical protein